MRNFIISLLLINVFPSFAMKVEHAPLPALPLEIVAIFEGFKVNACTQYKTNLNAYVEDCALPWTIAPVFVTSGDINTPLHKNLTNPQPGEEVLPNAQFWTSKKNGYVRLSEDLTRTDDKYCSPKPLSYQTCIYDGINKNNKAICVYKYNTDEADPFYQLYMFTQSKEFGLETKRQNHLPFFEEKGIVRSLMLENEHNRFMRSVKNADVYSLIRQDLIEPNEDASDKVGDNQIILTTDEPFIKTVSWFSTYETF